METYTEQHLASLLPVPKEDTNKYARGKLIIMAGSAKYPGAACLAALASQEAGAGYTEVISDQKVVSILHALRPSLVAQSWGMKGSLKVQECTPEKPCAYMLGSGFDSDNENMKIITYSVLEKAKAPVLLDGGALDIAATEQGKQLCRVRNSREYFTVLTPHEGEAQRLARAVGIEEHDPQTLSWKLAQAYGAIVVLKGGTSFVSEGEHVYVMSEGTPALAKAGTGDVLAGIIGAFLAQGLNPLDASILGTTVHARSGRLAAEDLTPISVSAEDVIDYLPAVFTELLMKI